MGYNKKMGSFAYLMWWIFKKIESEQDADIISVGWLNLW